MKQSCFDFNNFSWHSALALDQSMINNKKITKLAATEQNLQSFSLFEPQSKLLIHKSTKALWKFADDGKTIYPVFAQDILTTKDLEK